jgi:hypothetical protein
MSIRKLKKKLEQTKDELYDLASFEPSPAYYKMQREKLEFRIAHLEELIEYEKQMLPFKYMIYGFMVVGIGLLVWAYIVNK